MSAHGWDRSLAEATIKSVICRGRINASRKRNRELAAAGTPVPRGRPPARAPETRAPSPVPPLQALRGGEIMRLLNRRKIKRRRVTSAPDGASENETSADVTI